MTWCQAITRTNNDAVYWPQIYHHISESYSLVPKRVIVRNIIIKYWLNRWHKTLPEKIESRLRNECSTHQANIYKYDCHWHQTSPAKIWKITLQSDPIIIYICLGKKNHQTLMPCTYMQPLPVLRSTLNHRHFADYILKCIKKIKLMHFMQISLKFVPKSSICDTNLVNTVSKGLLAPNSVRPSAGHIFCLKFLRLSIILCTISKDCMLLYLTLLFCFKRIQ